MILTSCRVICLNKKQSAFKAFDLPLSLISNESFEQPIFGANYIYGICKPLLNSLPGNITFKVWLMNGGCGTFAPAYLKMVLSCRRNKGRGAENSVINSYQNKGNKKAYLDPNDPSVIYVQQPEIAKNINYNPLGYQPVPQQPQPMEGQFRPQNMNQPTAPNNFNSNHNNGDENDLPSEEEIKNNQNNIPQQSYPNQGMEGLNNVINNQQQPGAKYFGFWGPNLEGNPNNNNNNGQ
jgi:hypothetical protein